MLGESDLIMEFAKVENESVVIFQTAQEDLLSKSYIQTDNALIMIQGSFLIAWQLPKQNILSKIKKIVSI